jgi:hypothetical protein
MSFFAETFIFARAFSYEVFEECGVLNLQELEGFGLC